MDVHKNAPPTPAGREAMVRRVVEDGADAAGRPCSRGRLSAHGAQMGRSVPGEPWRRVIQNLTWHS